MQHFQNDLGILSDPYVEKPLIQKKVFENTVLLSCFQKMLWIRLVEEAIGIMVQTGEVKCPCHLGVGQEAIPVGVSQFLRSSDRVFSNHRSHGHYLALGGGTYELLAEVLGRVEGCAKGRGGSMHIIAQEQGFYGSVPIVAGTIPLAVGAALAAKCDQQGDIAVAYFGDGACEEGIVHECLNLASVMELPILFVVENNLFSSHLDIKFRQPSDRVARFADAHVVKNKTIDGNNICAVMETADELISEMRVRPQPAFLEAITYRWKGHVGANDDIDVGLRRSIEELQAWKKQDPIERLYQVLCRENCMNKSEYESLISNYNIQIKQLIEKARLAPYPDAQDLLKHVYKDN